MNKSNKKLTKTRGREAGRNERPGADVKNRVYYQLATL